jgi:N-acetylneuraminic acid mutarotase
VVISAQGSGVLAGGLLAGDVSSDKVYRVTAARGVGARLPSLVEPIHDGAGTRLGDGMIIVGGGNTSELSVVEASTGIRRPWRVRGRLPTTRSDLSVTTTTSGVLVIGGYDGLGSPRQVLRTDDGRSFTAFASLRQGVRYAAVVPSGNLVWVFGGEHRGRELRTTQVIDLAARTVRLGPRLPMPLGHAAVMLAGSRILLMGGRTAPHRVTAAMWWFDPGTGRYVAAGRLPYPVADAALLNAVDGAYLLGGESPDFTNRVIRIRIMR